MNYQIEFNDDDLKVLNDALVRMPYGTVAGLIAKINEQINNALQKANHTN